MVTKTDLAILSVILAVVGIRALGSVPILVSSFLGRFFDSYSIFYFVVILLLYRLYTWEGGQNEQEKESDS